MKPRRSLWLSFLVWASLISPGVAETSPVIGEIADRLDATPVVRVAFTQTRHMEILSKPIRTEGRLVFSEGQGIAWLIEKPFPTKLALTDTHVTEWGDKDERMRSPLSTRPRLASLVSFLIPLLAGNFDELDEDFLVEASLTDGGWQVILTPKAGIMGKVISSIDIAGDSVVREVSVRESGGDWTQLSFGKYSPMPNRLTVEELAYFAE